jgi:hypothetical protein
MDLQAAKAQNRSRWTWARNGALLFFLLSGILLLASLGMVKGQRAQAEPAATPHQMQLG